MSVKKKIVSKKPIKSIKKVVAKKTVHIAKKSVKAPVKKVVAKSKPIAKKVVSKAKPIVKHKPVAKKIVAIVKHKKVVQPAPKKVVAVKHSIKKVEAKAPPKPIKIIMPKITTKSSKKYEPDFTRSVLNLQPIDYTIPTQRYSDIDLKEFRELIQKKLEVAKKELGYLQGLITRKDESGDMDEGRYMTMEDGSVSMEREQLSQMASRQIIFIDHLEKAMMRIENKTYGICRVTGKLIDKARLRAVPHATLSFEAKQGAKK
ncbi:MAG: TraR/DksA family transcriptional regulator [Chitinophagaceae bacterium]|nr:MAG: TraR/DksA family transcriptional regulator [Chitinophagaceae bacterium]